MLPFGLCAACYMFAKVVRPLVHYWRALGICVLVYLGFVVHPGKSIWNPVQSLIWLGFEVDLEVGQIWVPEHKIVALTNMFEQVRKTSRVSARVLASLLGKIISMGLAFGPVSRFMTRSLYAVLESRQSWRELLWLSAEASAELAFGPQVWSSIMPSPFGIPHLRSEWSIRMLVTPVLAAM